MSQQSLSGDGLVYVTSRKGRGTGKLHTDPNCRALDRAEDAHRLARPRSHFDEDREYCRVCTGGER